MQQYIKDSEPITSSGFSLKNKLRTAYKHFFKGQMISARNISKSLVNSSPDSADSFAALRLILNTIRDNNTKDSVKVFLQLLNSINNKKDLYAYSRLLYAGLNKINYISALDEILEWYPETNIKPYIYFKKFTYYLFDEKNLEKVRQVYNQMKSLFPENALTREAYHLLSEPIQNVNKLAKQKTTNILSTNNIKQNIPTEFELLGNFPNPFNPIVTISYAIPEVSEVRITVYDILGNEVAKLVNEEQPAAYYNVVFNANNLSSGVYFYRLTAVNKKGKVFEKISKMMMMK